MAITGFPYSAVCYILVDIPGEGEFQGSGAIIGPHTILTASHLLWDADAGVGADRVSVYPGFTPDGTTYNPTGALPGIQSIHYIKVADNNDLISAAATQSDFAVIDTSADLSGFGQFALDPGFTAGDVIATGYPAARNGYQTGTEGVVSTNPLFSDLDDSNLRLSPGYSGGPLWDKVERGGSLIPAVVGTVSTNADAMKLTKRKIALIRHWIAFDSPLYAGGTTTPGGTTPQIDGTVSGSVDAARVAPGGSATELAAALGSNGAEDDASEGGHHRGRPGWMRPSRFGAALASAFGGRSAHGTPERAAVDGSLSDLVDAIHGAHGGHGDIGPAAPRGDHAGSTLAAPDDRASATLHAPKHDFGLGA